jgi:hypothetical protein
LYKRSSNQQQRRGTNPSTRLDTGREVERQVFPCSPCFLRKFTQRKCSFFVVHGVPFCRSRTHRSRGRS